MKKKTSLLKRRSLRCGKETNAGKPETKQIKIDEFVKIWTENII
jgi:hypothetical protein